MSVSQRNSQAWFFSIHCLSNNNVQCKVYCIRKECFASHFLALFILVSSSECGSYIQNLSSCLFSRCLQNDFNLLFLKSLTLELVWVSTHKLYIWHGREIIPTFVCLLVKYDVCRNQNIRFRFSFHKRKKNKALHCECLGEIIDVEFKKRIRKATPTSLAIIL